MSNPAVTVQVANLPRLQRALNLFRETTGKTWGDILAWEAKEWANELYAAFKEIRPAKGEILEQGRARGYRVLRRAAGLVGGKVRDGVSAAAMNAAENYLEGRKSDYFSVTENEGILRVRRVRFSARKGHKRLKGSRHGTTFAKSAIHADALSSDALAGELVRDPSMKRLNLRALSVAMELSLRARGATGGTMALQWAYKVYKRSKSSVLKTGPLVNRNKDGVGLGEVNFTKGPGGEPIAITISGKVPGTADQAAKHGIIAKVEAIRVGWRMKNIMERIAKQKQKAGLK